MANKVTIDVEARFIDNVTDEAKAAAKAFSDVEKAAEEVKKDVDAVGKTKANPKITMDADRAAKKLDDFDKKLKKVDKTNAEAKLRVADKATALIDKVTSKAKAFASKTYSGLLKVRDSNVLSTLNKMSTGLKSLTGKVWSIAINVPSTVFSTLSRLKNALFSIPNLIRGIAAAWAASKLVGSPINVADAYSSAKIGFSTLLGEEGGQKMMDDLDEFAKATPFKTTGVIANAQKMMAMGWSTDTLLEDLEVIGNAAAATGKLDQGLESIVRAMSQIKTKGKLSTEELNQLAEAGIAAKAMLAENLGYGTGDAGIAAMTQDLERGAIQSDVAIQALIAGMHKYDGMMDSMANETVEGLISQMQDVFEINIVRKWGQGLQDGAKKGFGTIIQLLDESEEALSKFGDMLYDIGRTASNWVADKFQVAVDKILKITNTADFKNSSLKGKISMLWNGVVADPLKEWWENGGRDKTAETAGEIGSWMGKMITGGLVALFGSSDELDNNLGTGAGSSVAGAFVQGFLDNFDGEAITNAFVDAIGDVWDALPWWAKGIVGVVGAGTAAGGISKAAGAVTSFVGTTGTVGAGGAVAGGSGLLGAIGTAGVAGVGASGIMGGLANTGYALVGGTSALSMGGGAAALAGAGGIGGGLAGVAGLAKGGIDLYKGYTTDDDVEAKARKRSGYTALGATAAGAGVGFLVGGPLGALIGAGIGGIGGWIGGNAWANKTRDLNTTVGVNITGEKHIMNTIEVLTEDFGIPEEHADTVALLLTGDKELLNKIDVSKLAEEFGIPESQAKTIIEKLTASKSIENRLEVLAGDFGVPDSISKTISVNIKAIAGKIQSFVGNIFGNDEGGSGYRGGIFGGSFARGGEVDNSGIVSGSTRFIRVNEESPEMIIPLSDQRRGRALKLWAEAGNIMGVPGFARGGIVGSNNTDEGFRFNTYGGNDSTGGRTVQVNMGGVKLEFHVNGSDREGIVEAIKAQAGELADYFVGLIADALETEFENTPVRGGAT